MKVQVLFMYGIIQPKLLSLKSLFVTDIPCAVQVRWPLVLVPVSPGLIAKSFLALIM